MWHCAFRAMTPASKRFQSQRIAPGALAMTVLGSFRHGSSLALSANHTPVKSRLAYLTPFV
jgi:hypothetical protein